MCKFRYYFFSFWFTSINFVYIGRCYIDDFLLLKVGKEESQCQVQRWMKSQQVLLKTFVCDCKITEHYSYTISYGLLLEYVKFNLFGILIVCACLFCIDFICCYHLCLFISYWFHVLYKKIHYQILFKIVLRCYSMNCHKYLF